MKARMAGKVRIIHEMMASCDFGKNDAKGENVGRKIKLMARGPEGSRETCQA
jgi:hypothetical protein